jgi:hypothetical protein
VFGEGSPRTTNRGGGVRDPRHAVGYALIYPGMAKIAEDNGYSLALHGSLATDLDVVAIPWTKEAVDERTLLEALKHYFGLLGLIEDEIEKGLLSGVTEKPHGRRAWRITTFPAGSVDLSIMPRQVY